MVRGSQHRKRQISVCLVERNPLAARYLREVLECDPNIRVLSEYSILSNPHAFRARSPVFTVDVDTLRDPLVTYLAVLRSLFPYVRTLVVGNSLSAEGVCRLPFLGIQGFVSDSDVKERLVPAIEAIARGENWFAPEVFGEFLNYREALRGDRVTGGGHQGVLTPRERLVLGLVDRRLGNKEIATALHISEGTVKFHLSNVFRKLGVRDRFTAADLARWPVPQTPQVVPG